MLSINIAPQGDLEKDIRFFELLKACGFTHVGIEFQKCPWLAEDKWPQKVQALRKAIQATGIGLSSAHLHHYPLDIGCSVKYEETEELIARSVQAALKIGAPAFTVHPRSSMDQNFSREVSAKQNKEDFFPILEQAQEHGAKLLFENMAVFPDFPERRYFSSKPEEFAEFIDSFHSTGVGVCWDVGHAHMLLNEDEFGHMKQLGTRIQLIELSNNWIRYDSHLLPSKGDVDWSAFAAAAKEMNYTGSLILDAKPAKVPEIAKAYYTHAYDCMKSIKERIDKA